MSARKRVDVTALGIFVLLLATLYYFYEFFLRVILGTIASNLMQDLHIGATEFALIGSAYYLTYSIMQTPVGFLVDRYGVKILLSMACAVCNIGVFLFCVADGFWLALTARFLIGFGSAFAFVSILVLALNWFPRHQFAFLTGLIQFLGALGPFLAGAPLAFLLKKTDNNWRFILFWIAIFGTLLNLLLLFFVRSSPKGKAKEMIFIEKKQPLRKKLLELLKNPQAWWVIFYAGMIYAALPLFGAFWGTSYLKAKGFSTETAAFIISMIWIGLAIGCPLSGKFSDRIKRRKTMLGLNATLGVFASCCILYFEITSIWILCTFFFAIGFASSGQSLSFATIAEHVPKSLQGAALGLNNTMITLMGTIIPPIVSVMIQAFSPPGATAFSERAFEFGFSLVPILYLSAFFLSLFGIKETFCRSQKEVFHLEKS